MGVIDSTLTISVTANSTSGGQGVDFSGFAGATATLVNDQAGVSIQYAPDGVTWVTLAAGASTSLAAAVPSPLRLRKTSADNFPVPLTVDFDFTDQSLSASQVAAAGSAPRKFQARMSRGYGQQLQTAASPALDGRTWHIGVLAESDFVAARVIIRNVEATGYTFSGGSMAASSSITSSVPTGAFVNITFAGATSIAVPARLAANRPSTVVSDWIPVQSIARADGSSLPALHIRSYVATGPFSVSGANTILTDFGPGNAFAQARGRYALTLLKTGGDFATTNQAGFTSPTSTNLSPILDVEFLTTKQTVTLMGVGDSILYGIGGTYSLASAGHYACAAVSTPGLPYIWDNQCVPSTTSAQWLTRFQDILAAGKRPNALLYCPFTPNDGTPDASNIIAAKNRFLQVLDLCNQYQITPIVLTPPPNTAAAWDATADNFRKAWRDEILGMASSRLLVVDQDSVLSDQATPARYIAAMTSDGTHPSDAGHLAIGTLLTAALRNVTA